VTSDDNHDDDAQLQQLRAVWVSMRDEEPPERGLASLMAAARTKAAELEQASSPSWWQRIAATLRRPPVLALATVTLLLGGALIVTQRSSQMKVEETAVDARLERSDSQSKGNAAPAAGSSAVIAAEPTAQPPADPFAAEGESAKPAVVPVDPPKVRDAKPGTKPRLKATTPTTGTATTTPAAEPEAVDTGAMLEAGPRGAGSAPVPALSIATDDAAPLAESKAAKQSPKKPIARTEPPSIQGEDRVVSKDAAKSTIEQLVKQCETAAARGDCAAARVIAQKILTSSPVAYKAKVVNNASINRCLPAADAATATD